MRALQLLGLVALAAASEIPCLPSGVYDTTLNFEGKPIERNNIGGLGTGEGVQALIFSGAGTTGSLVTGAPPNTVFDIMITNTSEYTPINYAATGLNGQFAQINMAPAEGNYTNDYTGVNTIENVGTFKICAVESGTGNSSSPTYLTLDSFPLTFYDL